MNNTSPILRAALAVLPILVIACSTSSSSTSPTNATNATSSQSLTDFCDALCGRLHGCDNSKDSETCSNQCANDNAGTFPKLRADIVSSIETCLAAKDCATVLRGTALNECAEEASAAVAPTSTGIEFCDAWAVAAADCDRKLDKAACLSLVKEYNDSTLEQAKTCTTKSCAAVTTCIEAVLDLSFGGGPSGAVR